MDKRIFFNSFKINLCKSTFQNLILKLIVLLLGKEINFISHYNLVGLICYVGEIVCLNFQFNIIIP